MPSLILTSSTDSDPFSHTQTGHVPRFDGSRQWLIDKSALTTSTTSSSPHLRENGHYHAYLYRYQSQSQQRRNSRPPLNESQHTAYIDPVLYGYVNLQDISARKAHNALQPISRLNPDVLEHLFIIGASLASSLSPSTSLTPRSESSLTSTILTYAQLTSSLRHVALSSARLWSLLVDFERASDRWLEELLRRSKNVDLELLFQWSKAHGSFHGAPTSTKYGGNLHNMRDSWNFNTRTTSNNTRSHRGEADLAKKMRLMKILRPDVLTRARTVGVAIPAPYFSDTLLAQLAGYADGYSEQRLSKLECLRIVRSRPRRGETLRNVVEGEGEVEQSEYVPLAVLASAPHLRDLAIAESCLPFHELLPYLTPSPPSTPSTPWFEDVPSVNTTIQALHTLANLRALHIVDLPLSLAFTAREWLVYLSAMPALEELVLEGAILGYVDLGARARERAKVRARGPAGQGEDNEAPNTTEEEDGSIEMASYDGLPRLRILTLDAALDDIGVLVSHLPLPFGSPSVVSPSSRGREQMHRHGKGEANELSPCKWTLLCAGAHAGELGGLGRVLDVFSCATGSDSTSLTLPKDDDEVDDKRTKHGEAPHKELSLSLSVTEKDVYVHLRSQSTTYYEPSFSIFTNFHVGASVAVDSATTMTSTNTRSPPVSLLPFVLDSLEKAVMGQIRHLEIDFPLSMGDIAFKHTLTRATKIEALSLGDMSAKSVLKILQQRTARKGSIGSYSSSSNEDPTLPDSDINVLPSLTSMTLGGEIAGGPTWISLVRCIKARRAAGTPIKNIYFVQGREHGGQIMRRRSTDDVICSERMKELEKLGVGVKVKGGNDEVIF